MHKLGPRVSVAGLSHTGARGSPAPTRPLQQGWASSGAPNFKNVNSVSLEGVSRGCQALVHTGHLRPGLLRSVTAQTHGGEVSLTGQGRDPVKTNVTEEVTGRKLKDGEEWEM